MKKIGFTLAEILVVLGVVGVVSALTLPNLMMDTSSAQIGPKLAKSVAMFEQANIALLNDQNSDSLLDTGLTDTAYTKELIKYLKSSERGRIETDINGSDLGTCWCITAKDGVVYKMCNGGEQLDETLPPYQQRKGTVIIDINGASGPGKAATDLFAFAWYADGSLKPYGQEGAGYALWSEKCQGPDDNGNKFVPTDAWACAGHIFDNNLKVLYK